MTAVDYARHSQVGGKKRRMLGPFQSARPRRLSRGFCERMIREEHDN